MDDLKRNELGIKLNYELSHSAVNFLDLAIIRQGKIFVTKYNFKKMDRNGYIPSSCCHHPNWLSNIPQSTFLRIRQNSSSIDDFHRQSGVIKQRFTEKVYTEDTLDAIISQVANVDRETILAPKDKSRRMLGYEWSFQTTYSNQHGVIKKLLNKHWKVLKNDEVLGPALPEHLKVIFKKALGLRHLIAPNVVEPPTKPTFFGNLKGYFPCRRCSVCVCSRQNCIRTTSFSSTVTGKTYDIEKFLSCNTKNVVYLLDL